MSDGSKSKSTCFFINQKNARSEIIYAFTVLSEIDSRDNEKRKVFIFSSDICSISTWTDFRAHEIDSPRSLDTSEGFDTRNLRKSQISQYLDKSGEKYEIYRKTCRPYCSSVLSDICL